MPKDTGSVDSLLDYYLRSKLLSVLLCEDMLLIFSLSKFWKFIGCFAAWFKTCVDALFSKTKVIPSSALTNEYPLL